MTISNSRLTFSNMMTDHWPIDNYPNINSRSQDFCVNIPCEIFVKHIFPHLNLHELGLIRRVNKQWEEFSSEPILWQSAVYREIAFSSRNWAEWDADLVKDVNLKQEILSLPKNIAEELRCSAFPGKSIRETHVLVRMPKGLTIKRLGELTKKYFPNNVAGYRYIESRINENLGSKSTNESVWLLMTKNILRTSKNANYSQQKNIVAKLAEKTCVPYQVPTILEAATCILAEYAYSKKRLFSNKPYTYIYCQENVQSCQIVVGGLHVQNIINSFIDGLVIDYAYERHNCIGIAALRKF